MRANCKPRFFRDTSSGDQCINCSCGWTYRGAFPRSPDELEAVALTVQTHRPPLTKEPPPKVEGFVSGLPDKKDWP
jgi:hypothetical protein